jgi:hypothetical protein
MTPTKRFLCLIGFHYWKIIEKHPLYTLSRCSCCGKVRYD